MLQVVATLALTLMFVAKADSPAKRDVYRFVQITRRPTKRRNYMQGVARSDGYTARPTPPYAARDGLVKMFGNVRSDVTKRPTPQRYPQAKGDGFMKYFRKYFTTRRPTSRRYNAADDAYRRPTQRPRYNAASDAYRRPTQRPRYNVASDAYRRPTQRPTPRRYGVQGVVPDRKTGRPTKPYLHVAQDKEKVVTKKKIAAKEVVPEPELLDKKYFYLKTRASWNEAQEACARRGAQLATIHSAEEHERVSRACAGGCWLGATRKGDKEAFTWTDESAMDFGHVDTSKNKELCARVSGDTWTSADCTSKAASVCEKLSWKPRVEAKVDDYEYASSVSSYARGKVGSLALLVMALVVVVVVVANYVCVVVGEDGKNKAQVDASDETTPLLWTRD